MTNRQERNDKSNIGIPPRISGFETGDRQQNQVKPVRTNQNTNYYGRTIGQPVKVEKQMRAPTPAPASRSTESRSNRDSNEKTDSNRK